MAKEQAAAAFEEESRRRAPKDTPDVSMPESGKAVLAQRNRERDEGTSSAAVNSRTGSRNGSLIAVD
ncbi:hypothetical protein DHEL01_v202150 [Diaporthe helianthi]|uniref:Uncharacterized protein n=1 Tax=Diaporthe helianthi TaxID=158607 RepID=A0A2P5IAF6_DIAHE|nr:hypothetical protein DHEL01_v202150 [Diaporthe helianthi]